MTSQEQQQRKDELSFVSPAVAALKRRSDIELSRTWTGIEVTFIVCAVSFNQGCSISSFSIFIAGGPSKVPRKCMQILSNATAS